MALTLGIIGFAKSGKTTIFNTLTGSSAETSAYGTNQAPNIGTVKVPDPLLDRLTDNAPDKEQEADNSMLITHSTLRRHVLRDLQWLFNTINNEAQQDSCGSQDSEIFFLKPDQIFLLFSLYRVKGDVRGVQRQRF